MRHPVLSILLVLPLPRTDAPQKVVPVYEEPRHHLVFEHDRLRVLDVQIPPGETTLYHTHSKAIFYVAIAVSPTDAQSIGGTWGGTRATDVPRWRPGGVGHNLKNARQPLTHRIRNVGKGLFRLIAVTNEASGPSGAGSSSESELPDTLETEVTQFHQSRVRVAPGASSGLYRSPFPIVVVQVDPGDAELLTGDGGGKSMTVSGNFGFVDSGHTYELRNRSRPGRICTGS